jgi:hypothetical protein
LAIYVLVDMLGLGHAQALRAIGLDAASDSSNWGRLNTQLTAWRHSFAQLTTEQQDAVHSKLVPYLLPYARPYLEVHQDQQGALFLRVKKRPSKPSTPSIPLN